MVPRDPGTDVGSGESRRMRVDQSTYRLATRVSLAGLVLQTLAGVALLAAALWAGDDATFVGAIYALLGIPVWALLVALHHQHRLERDEAFEAETLAAEMERTGSIFEFGDEGLDVAARRLRWMHLVLTPAVSLLLAVGLIAVGLWQAGEIGGRLDTATLTGAEVDYLGLADRDQAPWAMAVTALIAVVAFIFSRFVSGMSKQMPWRLLRGGAATLVGTALVGAVLAVGHGFLFTENEGPMRLIVRILPWFVVAVGVEVAIGFVLNLYRPRRTGEIPRPAFDSRLLGILAAPDSVVRSISEAVNYQFGFEVTSTWFYRLASRQVLPLLGLVLLVLAGLNSMAVVEPHEKAIVLTAGRLVTDENGDAKVHDSGLLVKWPWQSVERYPVDRVRQVLIGTPSDVDGPILWGRAHTTATEDLIIVEPTLAETPGTEVVAAGGEADDGEGPVVAKNYGVLNAEVPIQFRIRPGAAPDGEPYLLRYIRFASGNDVNRQNLIRLVGTRKVHQYLGRLSVDEILGSERAALAEDLRTEIQAELDELESGVEIVFVGAAGVHPPMGNEQVKVADAFEQVLQAREEREATIRAAEAESIRVLAEVAGTEEDADAIVRALDALEAAATDDPRREELTDRVVERLLAAGGEAAGLVMDARAERWARHMDQRGRTILHNARLSAYLAAPALYEEREYLRRFSEALSEVRAVINATDNPTPPVLLLDEDAQALDIESAIREEQERFSDP